MTLAIGVFVAGLLQVFFQMPFVARLGLLSWPRWQPAAEGVRRIGKLMVPGIIGSSMAQVSLLLDTLIASFLMTGSIAWLYYADRLMEFPLGVFSIALATVILPGLSAHHASESVERFSATLDWALRLVMLLVVPASVALLVFAGPITATIFGYGKFSDRDVLMTQYGLMAYSWGLLALQPGEGAGARLLRAPGHAHAGARRADRAGCQHGAEHRRGPAGEIPGLPRTARVAGDLDLRVGGGQHAAAVAWPAPRGRLSPGTRLAGAVVAHRAGEPGHGAGAGPGSAGDLAELAGGAMSPLPRAWPLRGVLSSRCCSWPGCCAAPTAVLDVVGHGNGRRSPIISH